MNKSLKPPWGGKRQASRGGGAGLVARLKGGLRRGLKLPSSISWPPPLSSGQNRESILYNNTM